MTPRSTTPNTTQSGFAVAYLRVSTDEQSQSGLGLEAQTAAIQLAAARAGLTIRGVYSDAGLSGAKPIDKRPQLAAALDALQRGDVLIVAKRDRLARDVMQSIVIEAAARRKKARIVSAAGEGSDSDDPSGFMLRGMIDLFAQYERLVIRHRTSAALQAKRARGERYGQTPYGMRVAADGRRLEPNPAERAMLVTALECRAAGASWRQVAERMNADGYRNRKGGAWTLFNIRAAAINFEREYQASPATDATELAAIA